MASQIAAITGEELSLSVLSFSDKLVPWSPLRWEGVAQFYTVLVPPGVWGREGELPQRCESVQALAYEGNLSPAGADFREVSRSAHTSCALTQCPQLGTTLASSSGCLCVLEPSEQPLHYNASLAFLPFTSVTQVHVLVPHAELGCQGGSGSAQRVSCLELADLVPREVHIGTELSFSAV